MMPPKPVRLTTQQAADWLDIPKGVLLAAVRAGKIKAIRAGRSYLFTQTELLRYDREREQFRK